MNKISLSDYKGSMIYFHFFDTYIKLFEKGKEVIFNELYINNSSYRRCREKEQGVGPEIISKLAKYYNLRELNVDEIDSYEIYLNDLYSKIYYKDNKNYEEDLNKLEQIINEKNILFPLFQLMRLLMLLNSKKSVDQVYEENLEEYLYMKKFTFFFKGELKTIFNIVSLFFEKGTENCEWNYDFKNALAYQILASKCYKDQKYVEAVFFATKSNEILLNDYNYKRIITVNNVVMRSLLYIGNYEQCLDVATKQLKSLEALGLNDFDVRAAQSSLSIALLGLERYEEVVYSILNQEKMDLSDITCLLIAKYMIDKVEYKKYFSEFISENNFNDNIMKYLNLLSYYFTHRDKKMLKTFEKYNISGILIKILRNV